MSVKLDVCLHFILLSGALVVCVLHRDRRLVFFKLAGLYIGVTALFYEVAAAINLTGFLSGTVPNNLFVYHPLTPIQYTLVALLFLQVIKNKVAKQWITRSIPVFWVIAAFFTCLMQPLTEYPTYSFLINYVLTIAIVLFYFIEILNSPHEQMLIKEPAFWIGTGLLFHSVGNVFAKGISNEFLKNSDPLFFLLDTVSSLLNYVLFSCFIIAFVLTPKFSKIEERFDLY